MVYGDKLYLDTLVCLHCRVQVFPGRHRLGRFRFWLCFVVVEPVIVGDAFLFFLQAPGNFVVCTEWDCALIYLVIHHRIISVCRKKLMDADLVASTLHAAGQMQRLMIFGEQESSAWPVRAHF